MQDWIARKYHALSQRGPCWAGESALREMYAAEHGGKMPGERSIGRRRRAMIRAGTLRCVRYRRPGARMPGGRRSSHGFLEAISLTRWLARKAKAKAEREAKRRARHNRPRAELPSELELVSLETVARDVAEMARGRFRDG